jgi:hypothetical protein
MDWLKVLDAFTEGDDGLDLEQLACWDLIDLRAACAPELGDDPPGHRSAQRERRAASPSRSGPGSGGL